MRMFQVDSFADRVFRGNPAAVLLLDDWLPEATMQAIAQENNLAETAFVRARADGAWDIRWFAPLHEVDFCGHATLAAAHILLTRTDAQSPLTFHTGVGELRVSAAPQGYCLQLPCLRPEPLDRLPPAIAQDFDGEPSRIFRNFENIFVDVGGGDAVRSFRPDLSAIAGLGKLGLVVTGKEAPGRRADFVARYFAPGVGIPEDPVTGSIHSTLVPYWAGLLGKKRLVSYQASSRGGWIDCELTDDCVRLTGRAVIFMEGTIFLPDA